MSLSDAVAAQIMGELHDLTLKIEAQQARTEKVAEVVVMAARAVENGKAMLNNQNEKILMEAVIEIKSTVNQISGIQENITSAAANSARMILLGEDGPMIQLDALVKRQNEALGWLNRATNNYAYRNVILPTVIACLISAVIGGLIARHIL